MKETYEPCEAQALVKSSAYPIGSRASTTGKIDEPTKKSSNGRITSSSFVIAWSIVILVFLTFFNQYLAYYQPETIGGVSKWIRYPILTEAFVTWLPIPIATLILFVIGHILLICYAKYLLQETVLASLRLFLLATVLSLLLIFPFDFTAIPSADIASVLHMFTRLALIGIVVALGVGILVTLIKLIVTISTQRATD